MASDMQWGWMGRFLRDSALNLFGMGCVAGAIAVPMMPATREVRSSPGIPRSQLVDHMDACETCKYEDNIRCPEALAIVDRTLPGR